MYELVKATVNVAWTRIFAPGMSGPNCFCLPAQLECRFLSSSATRDRLPQILQELYEGLRDRGVASIPISMRGYVVISRMYACEHLLISHMPPRRRMVQHSSEVNAASS
jgi:hypothetical protein